MRTLLSLARHVELLILLVLALLTLLSWPFISSWQPAHRWQLLAHLFVLWGGAVLLLFLMRRTEEDPQGSTEEPPPEEAE